MSQPRFERVHTDAGWHGRYVAANNRTVWTTETYPRRRHVTKAIDTFCRHLDAYVHDRHILSTRDRWLLLEIRDVDERPTPP